MLTTPVVTNGIIQPCTTYACQQTHSTFQLVPTALVFSRQNLDPSRTSLPLTWTQFCIFISPKGVTGACLPIYRGILRIGPVSNPGDSGNSAVSACPGPPITSSHPSRVSLSSWALIDRLLNYEKVERALVKHRGIFIADCGPAPPSCVSE